MHSSQWFLRRRFFKIPKIFTILTPTPWFEQPWIPCIPYRCFLPNLVKINTVVLEKKSFKRKVYAGQRMGGHHYSSPMSLWHRWAKIQAIMIWYLYITHSTLDEVDWRWLELFFHEGEFSGSYTTYIKVHIYVFSANRYPICTCQSEVCMMILATVYLK